MRLITARHKKKRRVARNANLASSNNCNAKSQLIENVESSEKEAKNTATYVARSSEEFERYTIRMQCNAMQCNVIQCNLIKSL